MLCGLFELFFTNFWKNYLNFSKRFHEYKRTENVRYKTAWDYSKNHLNTIFFDFIIFSKNFHEYTRTENLSNKIVGLLKKNHLNTIFCVFTNFSGSFRECTRTGNPLKNSWIVFNTMIFHHTRFLNICVNIWGWKTGL